MYNFSCVKVNILGSTASLYRKPLLHTIKRFNLHVITILDCCRDQSLRQLRSLSSSYWLDDFTRAVFVEFTLFHPPTGLFTSVILFLEIPDTGGVTPGHSISSTYLHKYTSRTDHFLLFCEVYMSYMKFIKRNDLRLLKKELIESP